MIRASGAVALLFVICCGLGFAAAQLQLPSFPPDFESRCVFPGLGFMQGCEPETVDALAFFGVENPGEDVEVEISTEDVANYIAQAKPPSAACCQSACLYANSVCNCEPVATAWAERLFFGAANYAAVIENFMTQCQHKDLLNQCPDSPEQWALEHPNMNICDRMEEGENLDAGDLDEEPLEESAGYFAQPGQQAPATEFDVDEDSVSSMLEDLVD